jgi:ZIP family zinc transporter
VGELNEWQQRAEEELQGRGDTNTRTSATIGSNEIGTNDDADNSDGNNSDTFKDNQVSKSESGNKVVVENAPSNAKHEEKKLVKMGMSTALAIALHNFPEGLATFVAALDDPSVGAVLAIAIGIHNIPEGLCVALPIYYATGNRCKAFWWGTLSGVSEPIAALLGWAVLANAMSDHVYAILFGLVSGMMVIISMKELIPTAHRYDPEDTVVTYSVIGGMVIIALSLVLFKI